MKCPACGASGVAIDVGAGRRRCMKCRAIWYTAAAKRGVVVPVHYLPPASVDDLEWLWQGTIAPQELPE